MGGSFKLSHNSWLNECNKLVKNKSSTCSYYYYESSSSSSDLEKALVENNCDDLKEQEIVTNNRNKRPLSDISAIENKKLIIQKEEDYSQE